MSENRIFFALIFLLMISLSISTCVADEERSYSIPWANSDLYVQEDGNLHIKETIHYSFSGTYHGVYRDIPISSGEIKNLKISAKNAYYSYSITNDSNMEHITIFLFSNSKKTSPINNKDVDIIIEYDMVNVITIYDDVAELHYKLWGEGWRASVGQLTANIHLVSSDGVEYWFNPPYYVKTSKWKNNTLMVTTTAINTKNWFEVRMVIPREQFQNPIYARQSNTNGLSAIKSVQDKYETDMNIKSNFFRILGILMVLSPLIPLSIYLLMGREPKINYHEQYERYPPTNDSPAVVNAVSGNKISKNVGQTNIEGFMATILDLTDRNYLLLYNIASDNDEYIEETAPSSVFFEINKDEDFSGLKPFELDVIKFFEKFETDGVIYLDKLNQDLREKKHAISFVKYYKLWKKDLKQEFLTDERLKQIFIKSGDTFIKTFGVVCFFISMIFFLATVINPLPAAKYTLTGSIILAFTSLICILLPQEIAGRWTPEGKEYDAKWQSFKRYLEDFSIIQENPPESIAIWNKYLVYATALGIADSVKKSMETILPTEDLLTSSIYVFNHQGSSHELSSSLHTGMTTVSGGSGGVGGAGGGFGGGGGGAF